MLYWMTATVGTSIEFDVHGSTDALFNVKYPNVQGRRNERLAF